MGFIQSIILILSYKKIRSVLARRLFEEQETRQQDEILKYRLYLITTVQKNSEQYLIQSDINPMKTYIQIFRDLLLWDDNQITPDLFEDQVEKENLILTHQKLVNLYEKCKSTMHPEDLDRCKACLTALNMQDFILTIADHLEDFRTYLQVSSSFEITRKRSSLLMAEQFGFSSIIFLFAFFTFIFFTKMAGYQITRNYLAIWIAGSIGLAFGIILLLEKKKPGNLSKMEQNLKEIISRGLVDDEDFWILVRKTFGGLPDWETLKTKFDEEALISAEILGEKPLEFRIIHPSYENDENLTASVTDSHVCPT
jgi:hypothetical protein